MHVDTKSASRFCPDPLRRLRIPGQFYYELVRCTAAGIDAPCRRAIGAIQLTVIVLRTDTQCAAQQYEPVSSFAIRLSALSDRHHRSTLPRTSQQADPFMPFRRVGPRPFSMHLSMYLQAINRSAQQYTYQQFLSTCT